MIDASAGLYIHVPFCRQRCSYCDFYFVTGQRDHSAYVDALCLELRQLAELGFAQPLQTIYLGGGTPSRLAIEDLDRLLSAVQSILGVAEGAEVTMELNPEDCSTAYVRALGAVGINRASLGIQSFFDDELQFMNRSHDAVQAQRALIQVAEGGFNSFSVDVIFGLPQQPPERWAATLDQLTAYHPPHISAYALTIEPKTPLMRMVRRNLVTPARDDVVATHYQMAIETLRLRGWEHYEISSFAQPGHRAVHNQRYLNHQNTLGAGPAAVSFCHDPELGPMRWSNVRSLRRYLKCVASGQSPVDFRERLTPATMGAERIMLSLRTAEGIPLDLLRDRYGIDLLTVSAGAVRTMQQGGLIACEGGFLRLTDRGKHLCDSVTEQLWPSM